jgi:hypothetical protein
MAPVTTTEDTRHAEALDDLSIALAQAGRADEALELAERAAKQVAALAREAPGRHLEPLARVCNNLGRRYSEAGRLADAVDWASKAAGGFDVLAEIQVCSSSLWCGCGAT